VMVAVANPQNALKMIHITRELCRAKEAQIELLHMVPVPDQIPLHHAGQYVWEGKEAIAEALLYLKPKFSISTTIRYCRNVARGIVSAVRQKRTDLLIMGWHGKPRSYGFLLGSTVDPIIERSPCHIVILKDGKPGTYKNILVLVAGGPNSSFAMEVADILAVKPDGMITAFNVTGEGGKPFKLEGFVWEQQKRLGIPPERVRVRQVQASSVVDAILSESVDYDLVIVGCTRRPLLYKVTHESIPDVVAQRCEKPLLMVKSAARIESWLKRFI